MRNKIAALMAMVGMGCTVVPVAAAGQFVVGPDTACKTIASALAEMKDGDTCLISEGVYRECINVVQSNVVLRGVGRVVVTGCDEGGEMRPVEINGRKGLKMVAGGPVYEVFSGGQCLMPARYPNKTFPMTSNMDWEESLITPEGRVVFSHPVPKRFTQLDDGYYVGLHGAFGARHGKLSSWYSLTLPITGVGAQGRIDIDAAAASSGFMGKYGQGKGLGYIIGAKAVLDAPGEWYADGRQVLLIPPTGSAGGYELRTRLYGAVVSGDGVLLENIRFKAAAARVGGNDVSFKKCGFEYISPFRHQANDQPAGKRGQSLSSCWGVPENGTAGVFVEGDRFTAEDCRFARSWWCGMMVRGNHARIENCLFEDMNWMAKRCAALFSWGDGNVIRFCTFRNLGSAAIEGGNANWIGQYARNNIWEYNYIEDVCKLAVDQGFFYVNQQSGSNPPANSVWRYNVGKGARGPEKGNWTGTAVGYYVDNSSSGYRIHHNIAIDANEAIRYNDTRNGPAAGKDIWYYNNTFYQCDTVAYGCFSRNEKSKADAECMLVNNLAVSCGPRMFDKWATQLKWKNNLEAQSASALKNPNAMEFAPVEAKLKNGGKPVLGKPVSYVGAVDPAQGMWRYGADESQLPLP